MSGQSEHIGSRERTSPLRRSSDLAEAKRVLAGGGEMGELMRSIDWAQTPIGPVDTWSPALRSTIGLLLHNHSPLLLWWGPSFVQLYNDAYRPILGEKHPRAMGQPTSECWTEIWHIIGPMIERPFRGGAASTNDDLLLGLRRKHFLEETHFRVAYSPVPDETVPITGIGGVLATVTETTEQVYGERQLRTLRELGERSAAEARTVEDACVAAASTLGTNTWDVPFALFYLLEDDGQRVRRVASVGFEEGQLDGAAPVEIDISGAGPTPWSIGRVIAQRNIVELDDLSPHRSSLPESPWSETPRSALALPLATSELVRPYGVLICGISPHRVLDTGYKTFFELAAAQVVVAIRNARALEEERKRAEALAEIDRAKTAFFSNVSHEFRTPLTLMLGPTEDLLGGVHGELTQEQRVQLELLRRNELRLQRLVNALLEFSRIEAGRVQANYEQLDLAVHTRDLASAFRAAVERAGLTYVVDCASVGDDVFVDRAMWEQIVLNLISNAFKFTFEGQIAVSLQREARAVVLRVKDTGVGVRPADVPRLFERFHRVEGTRARTHEGSGIGLALVHELVRLHGGSIAVDSKYGSGTTFSIRIPTGSLHLPKESVRKPKNDSGALPSMFVQEASRWLPDDAVRFREGNPVPGDADTDTRVLIADDNADMRDYLRRILGNHWGVETVADGEAALRAAKARPPDLVVSDAMMPALDGYRLLKALRDEPSTRHVPVIMLSARAGEEAKVEGLEAGADDYLVKPFSARELVARVHTHLELSRLRAQVVRENEDIVALLSQSPMAFAVLRGADLVFELANPPYFEIIGRSDVIGKPLWEVLPEMRGQGLEEVLRSVLETGEPWLARELPAPLDRQRNGVPEIAYFSFTAQPIRSRAGIVDRVMIIGLEVTAQVIGRRRAEEANERLAQSRASLERATTLREEFLTVASHELRTPLTTLGLQLDGLLHGLSQRRAEPEVQRWLRRAERARAEADRLETLIDGMVDVFQVGRERSVLDCADVDLADVAKKVVARFTSEAKRTPANVELTANSVVGHWDAHRLDQIITQLVSNGVKFGGGKTVRVIVDGDERVGRVTVKDAGMGIALEEQERIFGRFERARAARDYGGFGLGLWVVRELVTAMSGTVHVESEPGRGATFQVEVPRSP